MEQYELFEMFNKIIRSQEIEEAEEECQHLNQEYSKNFMTCVDCAECLEEILEEPIIYDYHYTPRREKPLTNLFRETNFGLNQRNRDLLLHHYNIVSNGRILRGRVRLLIIQLILNFVVMPRQDVGINETI